MIPTYETSHGLPANTIWCLTHRKHTCEGSSYQFLWLPLWCQWCPPRPRKGWCCTCLTSTNKCYRTAGVLRPSHIHQSLHPWFDHLDCPSAWAAQEGCGLHLEPHLWCHFSVDQRSCHQWYHPQVFQPFTSHDNTSQCLTGRPWCSTPAKWQNHGFCQQGPYWNQMLVCQHRERYASCHLQSREIPNMCLW